MASKDRWHAVARVECGEKPEAVAKELGVTTTELKAWYQALRKSAVYLWEKE